MNLESKVSGVVANESSETNQIEEIRDILEKQLTPELFKEIYKTIDENVNFLYNLI